jgi:hypothetical protein
MKYLYRVFAVICVIILCSIIYYNVKSRNTLAGHRVVLCIPVYGQSLALGEEAIRITDFDSLKLNYDGRIVNEHLNYLYGGYAEERWKRTIKRFFQIHRRSFELSIYRMAEELATHLGNDTIICTFPGGMGESPIRNLSKKETLYPRFIYDINEAYENAKKKGWDFYVPAICWMQGESDIIDYTDEDYKKTLKQIQEDLNRDIKAITQQKEDVRLICYQTNVVTIAKNFNQNDYNCIEMKPSQTIVDFINEDTLFEASGPTYPYHFMRDYLHIDAIAQQQIGYLDYLTAMNIIRGKGKSYGLIPKGLSVEGNDVLVRFRVPCPPLVLDTISVKYADHYGFSVINKAGQDILSDISIEENVVRLKCITSPIDCKVRYAVNGEKKKSGSLHGPRGNLRDSQGEEEVLTIQGKNYPIHNWCYQFDMLCR